MPGLQSTWKTPRSARRGWPEVRVHAELFLSGARGDSYIAESTAKLERRRSQLAEGRARNAEVDAEARRLHAEVLEERKRRSEESRERLREFDRQRAEYRAKLDREMAEAKVAASLAFDRRVARKEVKRHAWLTQYWTKIAKARDDKAFRDAWLAEVAAKNPKRARYLRRVFRSVGDSESARRAAEQFDLIRQKWVRVVQLLDADPTLTTDEAEEVADPEYGPLGVVLAGSSATKSMGAVPGGSIVFHAGTGEN